MERSADEIGRFERVKGRMGGKAVFAGTRILRRSVRELLAAGYSVEQVLAEYPSLTAADVHAAYGNR